MIRARMINADGNLVGEHYEVGTDAQYDKANDENVVRLFYGRVVVRVWIRPKNRTYDFLKDLYATLHFFEQLNGFVVLQGEPS